jgi:hypothetical protein
VVLPELPWLPLVLRQDKELELAISATKTQSAFLKAATLKLSDDAPLDMESSHFQEMN